MEEHRLVMGRGWSRGSLGEEHRSAVGGDWGRGDVQGGVTEGGETMISKSRGGVYW